MEIRALCRLPHWANWLLRMSIALLLLALLAWGVETYFVYQRYRKALDPHYASSIAGRIVTIKSLPQHYEYTLGIQIAGTKFAYIEDNQAKLTFGVFKFSEPISDDSGRLIDQNRLLSDLAHRGVPMRGNQVGYWNTKIMIDIRSQSNMKVAGQEMPYVLGVGAKDDRQKFPVFLGVVAHKTFICIVGENNHELDMNGVNRFLSYIQDFK